MKQFFIRYVAFLFLICSIIFIGILYSNHRNQFVLFIDYFQSMNKENLINDFRGMFGFFYEQIVVINQTDLIKSKIKWYFLV